jgi:hypothetical protein
MATLLRITDDSTRPELEEAIGHLRDKQQRAVLETTRAELQVSIDALLDRWAKAPA